MQHRPSRPNHSLGEVTKIPLMDNSPTPLRTSNLHRRAHRQTLAIIPKERRLGPAVRAQIEVHVRAVLVRAREPVLGAQRVPARGAQVVDHHHDGGARVRQRVAARVRLAGQLPAGAARGARARAGAHAEFILRDGRREAGRGEEAAGRGVGVAVGRAEGVAGAVEGEGCFEAGSR